MIQRSNRHVWVGLAFVLAAFTVAGAVYFGIKIGSSGEEQQATPILSDQAEPGEQYELGDSSGADQPLEQDPEGSAGGLPVADPPADEGTSDLPSSGSVRADGDLAAETTDIQQEDYQKNANSLE
jgi:hypothetical protein